MLCYTATLTLEKDYFFDIFDITTREGSACVNLIKRGVSGVWEYHYSPKQVVFFKYSKIMDNFNINSFTATLACDALLPNVFSD